MTRYLLPSAMIALTLMISTFMVAQAFHVRDRSPRSARFSLLVALLATASVAFQLALLLNTIATK